MKKRSIFYYLLIILPFLIAVGFSTWVIIYEFSFGPNKQESTLSSYFGTEQKATYCDDEVFPIQKNGDTIDSSRIKYFYKDYGANDSTYIEGGPIDCGDYNVKIIVSSIDGTSSEECVLKFTIEPRKLTVNTIEMDYSATYGYFTDFINNKTNYFKFYAMDGSIDKIFYSGAYDIQAMHNGYYYYGDLNKVKDYDTSLLVEPEIDDVIVGSTYLIQLSLKDKNFLVKDCVTGEYTLTPRVMFKYKTVLATINGVSNTLTTIEDAILNSSSDITLMGIDSNDNTYLETCFSKILDTNTYNLSGKRKLRLPYTSNNSDYESTYQTKLTGLHSALMIPKGVTLNLVSGSQSNIIIGAVIDQGGYVARHSVIVNNGEINVQSTCFIKAYGFLKGTGLINVYSGGDVTDVFRLYDWPGADEAVKLKDQNAFPVKEWSVCNISCKTRVYKGALYNSISFVVAVRGLIQLDIENIYIIGNDSVPNCLFKPSDTANNEDYIEKSANIINDNYTVTNQSKTIQNIVYIKGDYIDDTVSVNASSYSFKTSTSMAIPLSYYDITVLDNSKLTISSASYIFNNANCKLNVMENAELSINGNAFVAMLNNSSLNMNGIGANLSGSGTFAGTINCNKEQTVLRIQNYDKLTTDENPIIIKTGATTSSSYECLSSGNIKINDQYEKEQSFTDTYLYISEKYGDSYYYIGASEDEYTSYEIIYHTNGGDVLSSDIIPSFDTTYTITKDMLKKPYRKYYALENWYISNNFNENNIFSTITLTSNNPVLNVYANWEYQQYEFTYVVMYEDPETKESILLDSNEVLSDIFTGKFTYENLQNGNINISTKANYNDKTFYGWYVGTNEDGIQVNNTFKLSYLDALLEKGDVDKIPLFGIFKDYKEYTINFITDNSKYTFSDITKIKDGDAIDWPAMNFYSDNEIEYYCKGWFFDKEFTSSASYYNEFNEAIFLNFADENNVINVYIEFIEKRKIIYKNGDEEIIIKYYLSDDEIKLLKVLPFEQEVSYNLPESLIGYTYSNWIDNSTNKTYTPSEINISTFTERTVTLQVNKKPIPYSVEINDTNTTTTISVDNVNKNNEKIEYLSIVLVNVAPSYEKYKDLKVIIKDENGQTITEKNDVKSFSFTMPASNITISSSCSEDTSCIISGTLITLSDGSTKKIDDITYDDYIVVFNHETGTYDVSKMLFITHEDDGFKEYETITLYFTNDYSITIVSEHGFYDIDLMRYVFINKQNIESFIGHKFYSTKFANGGFNVDYIELLSYEIKHEITKIYCPVTAYHMNSFNNGLLSMPNFPYGAEGLVNIFEYDNDLKFNEEKMKADIEKYGIFEYEYFKDYFSYEAYLASPAIYLKVSIGKGYLTHEQMMLVIEYLLTGDLIE